MIVVGWRPDIKLKILPLSDVWKETPDSKCLCALLLYEKLLAQGSLPDFGGAGAFPVRYARCLFGVPYMEGGWLYPPLPVRCRVCTFVPNAVRIDKRMRRVSRCGVLWFQVPASLMMFVAPLRCTPLPVSHAVSVYYAYLTGRGVCVYQVDTISTNMLIDRSDPANSVQALRENRYD